MGEARRRRMALGDRYGMDWDADWLRSLPPRQLEIRCGSYLKGLKRKAEQAAQEYPEKVQELDAIFRTLRDKGEDVIPQLDHYLGLPIYREILAYPLYLWWAEEEVKSR